jgi:hypothetical protein
LLSDNCLYFKRKVDFFGGGARILPNSKERVVCKKTTDAHTPLLFDITLLFILEKERK